jgi:electron transfer flavoprotein alpha/beta subunit
MTNIVVLIKQVPDYEDRHLTDGDWTLDRAGSDPVLDEINEKAVEVALQLKEKHADADYKVVVHCPWAPTRPTTSSTTACTAPTSSRRPGR